MNEDSKFWYYTSDMSAKKMTEKELEQELERLTTGLKALREDWKRSACAVCYCEDPCFYCGCVGKSEAYENVVDEIDYLLNPTKEY